MDRNYIEQHLLVDRYIQGRLEGGELDEFEERLVWDESLVDEVRLAEHLRDGLREASAAQSHIARSPGFDLVAMVSGIFAVPRFAAAASFLIAVMLTAGVFMSPLVNVEDQAGMPELRTDIVPLFATRGVDVTQVAVDPDDWTVLLVDATGDYAAYRATVRKDEPDAAPIWTQDGLMPTYPDSLAVGMPGSALAAGRYLLTIEGVVPADTGDATYKLIQEIPFESRPAD
jgi:hypothetical protein